LDSRVLEKWREEIRLYLRLQRSCIATSEGSHLSVANEFLLAVSTGSGWSDCGMRIDDSQSLHNLYIGSCGTSHHQLHCARVHAENATIIANAPGAGKKKTTNSEGVMEVAAAQSRNKG
jgi:hypothetical protein